MATDIDTRYLQRLELPNLEVVEVMTAALADPTVWLMRELLHACWGRAT